MSKDTIQKALDRHAHLRDEHTTLKNTRGGCSPEQKRAKLAMKDEMGLIKTTRLPAFTADELRHELDDRRPRVNLCSTGNRTSTSHELRARLEADIVVLETALEHREAADEEVKKPRLVHEGEPHIQPATAESTPPDRIAV